MSAVDPQNAEPKTMTEEAGNPPESPGEITDVPHSVALSHEVVGVDSTKQREDDIALRSEQDPSTADSALPPDDETAPARAKDTPKAMDTDKLHANKQSPTKAKTSVSVKTAPGKSNGGPSTPVVKKVIDSGTFGAGTTSKSLATRSVAMANPPAPLTVKKSSGSAAAASRAPTTSSRTLAASVPVAPNTRRQLAITTEASTTRSPTSKPMLTSAKIPPATSARSMASGAASAVSPTGSAASVSSRPRASVSEGVKRGAPNVVSRQSIATGTKPLTTNRPPITAAAAKSSRTTTSISSVHESKENGTLLEDLRKQLKESNESLASKLSIAAELEDRIGELTSSLETSVADLAAHKALVDQLKQDKLTLEEQVFQTKETPANLKVGSSDGESSLIAIRQDLEAAKATSISQNELVESLRAQIEALENQVENSKESLRTTQNSTSMELEKAAVEHEAYLKAQADLKAIAVEAEALKAIQTSVLEESAAKRKELQAKAALVDDLNVQVNRLKEEKEETSGKLSELEVEILELKESQEVVEDERNRLLAEIKKLQGEDSKAKATLQQALQDAKARQAEAITRVAELQKVHAVETEAASREQQSLNASIELLKEQLSDAFAAKELNRTNALASAEAHARKLEEIEGFHANRQAELSEKMEQITIELQNQEAYYNTKLQAAKNEHSRLLEDAFERAKIAAGEEHTQELQALRTDSAFSIEQVQAANKQSIEDLKAEHATTLETEVNRSEKAIKNLEFELRVTQDDLAKTKAALDSARDEVRHLTRQRDEALAQVASAPNVSTHIDDVKRLSQELANSKDDLAAMSEMLDLTKASLTEMSNKQSQDLEDAARARAEEVVKLRAAHDEEVVTLANQKLELSMKVSDLEGELATLKATLESNHTAPKSVNGPTSSTSPDITKEQLQKMHEAHNLKIYDLEAMHEKTIKALRNELEASQEKVIELNAEVERKAMEIQYLEQDQDENQEQIDRIKEELDTLTNKDAAA